MKTNSKVEPMAWAVYCPIGHEHDYLVFADRVYADGASHDFEVNDPDGNEFSVIGLYSEDQIQYLDKKIKEVEQEREKLINELWFLAGSPCEDVSLNCPNSDALLVSENYPTGAVARRQKIREPRRLFNFIDQRIQVERETRDRAEQEHDIAIAAKTSRCIWLTDCAHGPIIIAPNGTCPRCGTVGKRVELHDLVSEYNKLKYPYHKCRGFLLP